MKFIAVAEGILTAVRGTETFKEAVSKSWAANQRAGGTSTNVTTAAAQVAGDTEVVTITCRVVRLLFFHHTSWHKMWADNSFSQEECFSLSVNRDWRVMEGNGGCSMTF